MKISHRPKSRQSALTRFVNTSNTPQKLSAIMGFVLVLAVFFISGFFVIQALRNVTPKTSQPTEPTAAFEVHDLPSTAPHSPPANVQQNTTLYVNPNSNAAKQAKAWPNEAGKFNKLASLATAIWVTSSDSIKRISNNIAAAAQEGSVPVLVSYNFHNRDCGGYSTGGATDAEDYKTYINELAGSIGSNKVIVIIEPDAIAQTNSNGDDGCSVSANDSRYNLLNYAVTKLSALPNTSAYLDAGNSRWIGDVSDIAARLQRAGVSEADGFSLNVSNFVPTGETIDYGQRIAAKIGNKHFVIDTSRNGLGTYTNTAVPTHGWCNPPGRALGHYPTTNTGHDLVDAFLYIKYPGESDGADPDPQKCFNGPKAGDWWPEYALGLIDRWPKELQP